MQHRDTCEKIQVKMNKSWWLTDAKQQKKKQQKNSFQKCLGARFVVLTGCHINSCSMWVWHVTLSIIKQHIQSSQEDIFVGFFSVHFACNACILTLGNLSLHLNQNLHMAEGAGWKEEYKSNLEQHDYDTIGVAGRPMKGLKKFNCKGCPATSPYF